MVEEADDGTAWADYVARQPAATLYHDYRWRELIRSVFGHQSWYLRARAPSGGIVGVLPLVRLNSRLFGDFLVSMPYFNYGGVLADDEVAAGALVAHAGQLAGRLGVQHVELRQTTRLPGGLPIRDDKVTMLLELPDDPDRLWHDIGAKRRAQVKRPLRERIEIHHGGTELLDDYYRVFARNMRDLGTPVYSRELFREILANFPGQTRIIVIRLDDRPVAAAFLIGHRGRLEIPWASSLREANPVGVNMLLYWEALKYAIEAGYRVFDFGRCSRDGGTYRFKKQWGAQEQPLYWQYWLRDGATLPRLNPDNPKYRLLIAMWQRLPLAIANRLGPGIVGQLP